MAKVRPNDVTELFTTLRAAYQVRNSDYDLARRRYRGEHWDSVTNPAPENRYSLTANYMRPAVRAAVRDLFSRMPGIQVMAMGADEESRRVAEGAEGALYRCWDENEADRVFRRVAFNMVLLRRGWIYYWWDKDAKMVRFRSVSPENVYEVRDGEDIVKLVMVSRRLTSELRRLHPDAEVVADPSSDDHKTHEPVETNGTVMSGLPSAMFETSDTDPRTRMDGMYTTVLDYFDRDGEWLRMTADGVVLAGMNLGYGTKKVPFIEFANDFHADEEEPESELPEDIVELNQYLDRVISRHADIIDKYANPTVIDEGSGQAAATVKRIVQGDGGVLPIRKGANVRYLTWEGTFPMISEQADRIQSILYDLTGRSAASYGQTLANQSGVMTNLAMSPHVAAATDRMVTFSTGLSALNVAILTLLEKFAPSEDLSYQGYRPRGSTNSTYEYFETQGFKAGDLKKRYRNRIKWPAVLRSDDPVFIQSELSKMKSDAGGPPAQSIYTTLENLGVEDVEMELDRIAEQLSDPRFHPDRLTGAINAATALTESSMDSDLSALMPGAGGDDAGLVDALGAAGNPNRDQLA